MSENDQRPPEDLAEQIVTWSRETFPEQTFERLARHLVEESRELQAKLDAGEPIDEEVADCAILIITFFADLESLIARRNIDPNVAIWAKHQRNVKREWRTDPVLGYDKRVDPAS